MAPEFIPFFVVPALWIVTGLATIGLVVVVALRLGFSLIPRILWKRCVALRFVSSIATVAVAVLVLALWTLSLWYTRAVYQQYFLNEPLAGAASQGNLQEVRRLLDKGASPDSYGVDFMSPAIVDAASSGHEEVVRLLLERGADPRVRDYEGRTALFYARRHSLHEVARLLEAAGAKE